MKYFRPLIMLAILGFVSVQEFSRPTVVGASTAARPSEVKIVQHENLKIHYAADVPDEVANKVAAASVDHSMLPPRDLSVCMRRAAGGYVVEFALSIDVTPEMERQYGLYARLLTDIAAVDAPISVELFDANMKSICLLPPVESPGELCAVGPNMLYHSKNITAEEAEEFVVSLRAAGLFADNLGAVQIVRNNREYQIFATFPLSEEQRKSAETQDVLAFRCRQLQDKVFDGARTTMTCTEPDLQPIEGLRCTVSGKLPDEKVAHVDNIRVKYNDSALAESAVAIANRFPSRRMTERQEQITLLSDGSTVECRVQLNPEVLDEFTGLGTFWGREVFSELPAAESVSFHFVDENDESLWSKDITMRHGACRMVGDCRLYYPKGTSESLLEKMIGELETVGLVGEDAGTISRLTETDGLYTLQIIVSLGEGELDDQDGMREEIQSLGIQISDAAFAEHPFCLQITDENFEMIGNIQWQNDVKVSEAASQRQAR